MKNSIKEKSLKVNTAISLTLLNKFKKHKKKPPKKIHFWAVSKIHSKTYNSFCFTNGFALISALGINHCHLLSVAGTIKTPFVIEES